MSLPQVSIIVVNYNGKKLLHDCLTSLRHLDYDHRELEIILVDNGSSDGSVSWVRSRFPEVKIISNQRNEGFAKPNNDAARQAQGKYLAFLNNDMRVDRAWLKELVAAVERRRAENVVCAAAKVLTWDGSRVDFGGAEMNFEGRGFQLGHESPRPSRYNAEVDLLFPNGGSMLIDRHIFLDVGGFDEDYFAYYEDVDLGWRLALFGFRTIFVPSAIAYHRHGATSRKFPGYQKTFVLTRNLLYGLTKNYSDENLWRALSLSTLLLVKRVLLQSEVVRKDYLLEYGVKGGDFDAQPEKLPREAAAELIAVNEYLRNLNIVWSKRQRIQKQRLRNDDEVIKLFRAECKAVWPSDPDYMAAQSKLLAALDFPAPAPSQHGQEDDQTIEPVPSRSGDRMTVRRTITIVTPDVVGEKMAGPAIRCWEFAQALGEEFDVILAVPNESDLRSDKFEIVTYSPANKFELENLAAASDALIVQGFALYKLPFLKALDIPLVVDLYCPFVLENLEVHKRRLDSQAERARIHESDLGILNEQLELGDFFICASERQRDFWLGMLAALNRINPYTYDLDPSAYGLLAVVPFGISDDPPEHTKRVLKGVYKGIKESDKLLIWGGGILNWLDTITVVKAMDMICRKRDDVKLFFMGTRHPNPDIPEMAMLAETVRLSKELGLYDKYVFFNEWVPYAERANYLLEADLGLSAHFAHLETRFSFRTRILDYIWAGLPIVATSGDYFADLIRQKGLGAVVDPEDAEGMAAAIESLLDEPELLARCRRNLEALQPTLRWSVVTEPLKRFLRQPRLAPDKLKRKAAASADTTAAPHTPQAPRTVLETMHQISSLIDALAARLETFERELRSADEFIEKVKSLSLYKIYARVREALGLKKSPPVIEVKGAKRVGQSFVANEDNLYRIDVKMATFARRNTEELTFHLVEEGRGDIVVLKLNAAQISDNQFHSFQFDPLPDSKGKRYYFYLESPSSFRGNCVGVYRRPRRGLKGIFGSPMLVFKEHYR